MRRWHRNPYRSPAFVSLILACVLGSFRNSAGAEISPPDKEPDTAVVRAMVPDSVRQAQHEQARAMYLMDLARRIDVSAVDSQASLTPAEKAHVKEMAGRLQPPPEAGTRPEEEAPDRGKDKDIGKDKEKGKDKP